MSPETLPAQNFNFKNEENKILEGAENKNVATLLDLMTRRPLAERSQ